jgi:predicted site-specific integrase-resolvase
VSPQTLRRWEHEGRGLPFVRTKGCQRRYNPSDFPCFCKKRENEITVAYARVSSHDQKEDLVRQEKMLELFCSSHGWVYEVISDLGSGMNYHKRGLKKLLHMILNKEMSRLVLTHKDRLLRFGSELIFSLCEESEIEVVLINKGTEASFEEELAADVLEIITVFSARLYGARSHKNKVLIDNLKKAVK